MDQKRQKHSAPRGSQRGRGKKSYNRNSHFSKNYNNNSNNQNNEIDDTQNSGMSDFGKYPSTHPQNISTDKSNQFGQSFHDNETDKNNTNVIKTSNQPQQINQNFSNNIPVFPSQQIQFQQIANQMQLVNNECIRLKQQLQNLQNNSIQCQYTMQALTLKLQQFPNDPNTINEFNMLQLRNNAIQQQFVQILGALQQYEQQMQRTMAQLPLPLQQQIAQLLAQPIARTDQPQQPPQQIPTVVVQQNPPTQIIYPPFVYPTNGIPEDDTKNNPPDYGDEGKPMDTFVNAPEFIPSSKMNPDAAPFMPFPTSDVPQQSTTILQPYFEIPQNENIIQPEIITKFEDEEKQKDVEEQKEERGEEPSSPQKSEKKEEQQEFYDFENTKYSTEKTSDLHFVDENDRDPTDGSQKKYAAPISYSFDFLLQIQHEFLDFDLNTLANEDDDNINNVKIIDIKNEDEEHVYKIFTQLFRSNDVSLFNFNVSPKDINNFNIRSPANNNNESPFQRGGLSSVVITKETKKSHNPDAYTPKCSFELTPEVQLKKKVTGILNRITPEKFDLLANKMVAIINEKVDDESKFLLVLNAILEKASTETSFAEQYADLCVHLSHQMKDFAWCSQEYDKENEEKIQQMFHKLMIKACEDRYEEQCKIVMEETGDIDDDNEREETILKRRKSFFGTLTIIGELYNKELISEKIVLRGILDQLIKKYCDKNPIAIEAVCVLFKTSGRTMDAHSQGPKIKKYVDSLKQLAMNHEFRIQCAVEEIEEMKNNHWKSRIQKEKAKKLDKIKEDFYGNVDNKTSNFNPISSAQDVRISGGVPTSSSLTSHQTSTKRSSRYNNPSSMQSTAPKYKPKDGSKNPNSLIKDKNVAFKTSLDDNKKKDTISIKSATSTANTTPITSPTMANSNNHNHNENDNDDSNDNDNNNNTHNSDNNKKNTMDTIIELIYEYLDSHTNEDLISYLSNNKKNIDNENNLKHKNLLWGHIIHDIFMKKLDNDFHFIRLLMTLIEKKFIINLPDIFLFLATNLGEAIVDAPLYSKYVGILLAKCFDHNNVLDIKFLIEFCETYLENSLPPKNKKILFDLLKFVIDELKTLKSPKLSQLKNLELTKIINIESSKIAADNEVLKYI